jgi:AcrR family transcriptional regulator
MADVDMPPPFVELIPPKKPSEKDRSFYHVGSGLSSATLDEMAAAGRTPVVVSSARERILDAAYDLFARRGIRDVGVDEVIQRAGVAKATLYRHFPSKDDLVLAFLDLREQRWTRDYVEAEAERRGATAEDRLFAIFDVFDEWFHRDGFEACTFVNVLFEMGPGHPVGGASISHLEQIRWLVRRFADEAGLRDTDSFAWSWHILMKGAIVAAAEGDFQAARRSKSMARLLIEEYR